MRNRVALTLIVLLLVILPVGAWPSGLAQSSETIGGANADVNCEGFISQADAQEVFDAAGGDEDDVYDLDGDDNGRACDGERTEFNGPDIACNDLKAQPHAQALFNAASRDPYGLDPNDNGIACDEGTARSAPTPSPTPRSNPRPTPTPVPARTPVVPVAPRSVSTDTGCDSTFVSNGRAELCAGQYVRTREFEGFAAFAARAQDGFGLFPSAGSAGISLRITAQDAAPTSGGNAGPTGTAFLATADGNQSTVRSKQQVKRNEKKKSKKQKRRQVERRSSRGRDAGDRSR